MTSIFLARRPFQSLAALALAAAVSGCSLENEAIPAVAAPSEFGVSITASALPDQLTRDGASQSVVTVTARGSNGQPLGNQRIMVGFVSPSASGAALSVNDVTTSADGRAVFNVIAPPRSAAGDVLTVSLTPVGSNFDNAAVRTFSIALTPSNPSAPAPSFTFTPATPAINEVVTFDASATTDGGSACFDACTYSWDFGDGSSGSGRIARHAYSSSGSKVVSLTVRDASGATSVPATQTVTVAAPAAPVAVITVSPSGDVPAGTDLQFDASGSTVGIGASIVEYTWVWGDASSNTVTTSPQTTHSFSRAGTDYVVRLTIRDSLGRTATTTATVATADAP